jgi:hypothetical protein
MRSTRSHRVIAGLDPAIQGGRSGLFASTRPAHGGLAAWIAGSSPAMTLNPIGRNPL